MYIKDLVETLDDTEMIDGSRLRLKETEESEKDSRKRQSLVASRKSKVATKKLVHFDNR